MLCKKIEDLKVSTIIITMNMYDVPDGNSFYTMRAAARCGLGADRRHPRRVLRQAQGALYMFPRLDPEMYPIDDQQFAYEVLAEEKVLMVQGTGFNWPHPDHFRLVFLPTAMIWPRRSTALPASWKAIASVMARRRPEPVPEPASSTPRISPF